MGERHAAITKLSYVLKKDLGQRNKRKTKEMMMIIRIFLRNLCPKIYPEVVFDCSNNYSQVTY